MNVEQLGVAIVAAFVVMQIVDALVKPVWERYSLDAFWYRYVALAIGAPLGWFTEINALPVFTNAVIGRVLTCLVIGLGPSFIHDLVDKTPAVNP